MNKFWKIVGFITIATILFIGIPFLINWIFKIEAPTTILTSEWEAGDLLNFYGSLLASCLGIIGVFFSIKYAQRNYHEDEINRCKPYVSLTPIRTEARFDLFRLKKDSSADDKSVEQPNDFYSEYRLQRIYVIISPSDIIYKTALDEHQEEILKHGGAVWNPIQNGFSLDQSPYVSMPFEVDNVGNGAAIDVQLAFYSNIDKYKDNKAIKIGTFRPTDSSLYIHIFSDMESTTIYGEYTLELYYRDILNNTYSQKYPVYIKRQNNKVLQSIDFTGKQTLIAKQ